MTGVLRVLDEVAAECVEAVVPQRPEGRRPGVQVRERCRVQRVDAALGVVGALGLSQPATSEHLRVLREAGLVRVVPDVMDLGTYIGYDGRPAVPLQRTDAHPVERVSRAVSDPAELAAWFPSQVRLEPRTGGTITFTGDPYAEDATGTVLVYDPPHRLSLVRLPRRAGRGARGPVGYGPARRGGRAVGAGRRGPRAGRAAVGRRDPGRRAPHLTFLRRARALPTVGGRARARVGTLRALVVAWGSRSLPRGAPGGNGGLRSDRPRSPEVTLTWTVSSRGLLGVGVAVVVAACGGSAPQVEGTQAQSSSGPAEEEPEESVAARGADVLPEDGGATDGGDPAPSADGDGTGADGGEGLSPGASGGDESPPPASGGGQEPPPAAGGDEQPPASGGDTPPPASGGDEPPPVPKSEEEPPPAPESEEEPPPASGGGGDTGPRPGSPDQVPGGTSGGETEPGRKGTPIEIPVFEDRGRPHDGDLETNLEQRCATVCTIVLSPNVEPDENSPLCVADFSYSKSPEDGLIQQDTVVTVHLTAAACESSGEQQSTG